MATIRRCSGAKGVTWEAQVRRRGHKQLTKRFRRKADADRWARQVEAEIDMGKSLPGSESRRRTLDQLIDRYLEGHAKRDTVYDRGQRARLAWWQDQAGDEALVDIRPRVIARIRDRLVTKAASGRPASASTRNRYLATLSVVMSYGMRELEWLPSNPAMSVAREREPRGRVRFLSVDERAALLSAAHESLDARLHLMVLLGMSTGMRQGEITGLRWQHLDLEAGIARLEKTKNGERRAVPLAGSSLAKLRELSKVRRINDDRVFAPVGRQALWPQKAWDVARRSAGLDDFVFHDLRHTAASYLAMSGATLAEIAEILGHKTLAMVKRYAHLTEQHTLGVAQRMAAKFSL